MQAQRAAQFTLLGDLAATAPASGVGLSLRDPRSGEALLRAVEAGSQTAIPVAAGPRDPVVPEAVRVLGADLLAYNAPNPFHCGRETTRIQYQVESSTDVRVRVYTLQGALVWESSRREDAPGPALRGMEWDGRNGAGVSVRNGVYVCRVSVGRRTTAFKIAVVR